MRGKQIQKNKQFFTHNNLLLFWLIQNIIRQLLDSILDWLTFLNLRETTGCFVETVKNYLLIAQAKKKPISLAICPFDYYIGIFWYLVSKKFNDHPVIIHLEILLRCETVQIWKIHWKLKYLESRYCFANISPTKAWIFMKFFTVVNYYLVNLSLNFIKIRSQMRAHES